MNDIERRFTSQSDRFIELALASCGFESVSSVPRLRDVLPQPCEATLIADFRNISVAERTSLRRAYFGNGVAYFVVLNPESEARGSHPLFDLTTQLRPDLHLEHPLAHPLETHPNVVERFGSDGTVKVFDFEERTGSGGYREQGETAEMFAMHHDGMGSGGTVETAVLYADEGPVYGGYTYFQNIVRISLELARDDRDALTALFLPDAVSMLRPRGKGALKVTAPILFLNELHQPQSIFRSPSGEYQIQWRDDVPALSRAKTVLEMFAQPFAAGSSFVHLSGKGHGCFIRNTIVAHGRTAFVNAPTPGRTRLLSRKWYMRSARDAQYKHVPGLFVAPEFAALCPQLFGQERLQGEWLYDPVTDQNVRQS